MTASDLVPLPLRIGLFCVAAAPVIAATILATYDRIRPAGLREKRAARPLWPLSLTMFAMSIAAAVCLAWTAVGIDGWLGQAHLKFGGFAALGTLIYLTVTLFRFAVATADVARDPSLWPDWPRTPVSPPT